MNDLAIFINTPVSKMIWFDIVQNRITVHCALKKVLHLYVVVYYIAQIT